MNVFKLNLDDFDKWINRYEELAGEIDYISDSVKRVTFEQLNNEVWQGEDADLFRTGMIELADSSMPDFANHIRENIEIMKESSVEFKECKKFCEDFILAFDENAKICNSLDDMHGILYCDYDAVNASVELCKNIEEEKYFIERSIRKIKNDMQGLHYSQPEIEKCLCKFESDVSELSRIEQHHHDIIKYASMVRAADDRLASRLVDIVQTPGGDDDLKDLNDYLKEKYWFLYDYLVNKKGLSEEEAIDYLIYLRDEKKTLSSYWATYNYSGNDYKKLIENIDCDLWIYIHLDGFEEYLSNNHIYLSENDKRKILYNCFESFGSSFDLQTAGFAKDIYNCLYFEMNEESISTILDEFYDEINRNYEYDWKKSEFVTDQFLLKVLYVSQELNVNPDDLMSIMAFESGFNPQSVNSSGFYGLIQFGKSSITQINSVYNKNYTKDVILNMSNVDQMDVVFYNFAWQLKDESKEYTLSDLYMTVFCPNAVGKEEDYILYSSGSKEYEANKPLDVNGDGHITKHEATTFVINKREEYLYD